MDNNTLFENLLLLPQRLDLTSINFVSQFHYEFNVSSEEDQMSYTVEAFISLDDSLTPQFNIEFEGTCVLEFPLMDGEDNSKVVEFFKQIKLNYEAYVESLHNSNRYTLQSLIKEMNENVNDIL